MSDPAILRTRRDALSAQRSSGVARVAERTDFELAAETVVFSLSRKPL